MPSGWWWKGLFEAGAELDWRGVRNWERLETGLLGDFCCRFCFRVLHRKTYELHLCAQCWYPDCEPPAQASPYLQSHPWPWGSNALCWSNLAFFYWVLKWPASWVSASSLVSSSLFLYHLVYLGSWIVSSDFPLTLSSIEAEKIALLIKVLWAGNKSQLGMI